MSETKHDRSEVTIDACKCGYCPLPCPHAEIERLERENARLKAILDFNKHHHDHPPTRVLQLLARDSISVGKACEFFRDLSNGIQGPLTDEPLRNPLEPTELATATERATKAEAGLSLAVRALEEISVKGTKEYWHDGGEAYWHTPECEIARAALSDSAILAEAERLKALEVVLEAARKIHHWHCWGSNEEGMVVSSTSVRGLWAAIGRHDAAIAQAGTEPQPNGLVGDTFASGTDWRGNA